MQKNFSSILLLFLVRSSLCSVARSLCIYQRVNKIPLSPPNDNDEEAFNFACLASARSAIAAMQNKVFQIRKKNFSFFVARPKFQFTWLFASWKFIKTRRLRLSWDRWDFFEYRTAGSRSQPLQLFHTIWFFFIRKKSLYPVELSHHIESNSEVKRKSTLERVKQENLKSFLDKNFMHN